MLAVSWSLITFNVIILGLRSSRQIILFEVRRALLQAQCSAKCLGWLMLQSKLPGSNNKFTLISQIAGCGIVSRWRWLAAANADTKFDGITRISFIHFLIDWQITIFNLIYLHFITYQRADASFILWCLLKCIKLKCQKCRAQRGSIVQCTNFLHEILKCLRRNVAWKPECPERGAASKTFLPQILTFLPQIRAFLPHIRTFLPHIRTFLPHIRTFLPQIRTFLPWKIHEPTYLSHIPNTHHS